MSNEKWVTWEGLQYYDSKIKDYVETQVSEIEDEVPSKDQLDALKDHIDENEAAIESLREFEVTATAEIATNKANIENLTNRVQHISTEVDKNHELIDALSVAVENKANEQHKHTLNDIIGSDGIDLSDYATKEYVKDYVDNAIDNAFAPDLSDYYTKSEIDTMIPEMEDIATKVELEVLTAAVGAVEESLDEKADKEQLEGLASQEFVLSEIAKAELAGKDVDLSAYYTKTEVDALIPDVSEFVTKTYVDEAIGAINVPEFDASNYYTKGETDAVISEALKSIDIPEVDLTPYAKVADIPTKVSQLENDANYLTTHQDISHLATKDELQDAMKEVSSTYVTNEYIEQNYITTEALEQTYVTNEEVNEIVSTEVTTVVNEQIEDKVLEVISEKIDSGELDVKVNSITYGTF